LTRVGSVAGPAYRDGMTNFVATRIVTDDVDALLAFYAKVTGVTPNRIHPLFGEIATAGGTLAIASSQTIRAMGDGVLEPAANRTVTLDFLVDDVDATATQLRDAGVEFVNEPTDMPWGNRSLLLRDPDGNLVNFFTPITPEGRARFGL
jgi:predicted enzyme related to lactoylglutathione lyase